MLIIEPFGLGDCVFVNGMIGALKRRWPTTRVHVVCRPHWRWLFSACPDTEVHPLLAPWGAARGRLGASWHDVLRTVRGLRRLACDIGFDIRGDVRSQGMLVAAGCRERIGYTTYSGSNLTLRGSLLTRVASYRNEHRSRQNLRLLELAGVPSPVIQYCLPDVPEPLSRFAVTLHPGAGWEYKLWKPERWAALITRLSERFSGRVQLLAHRPELAVVERITSGLRDPVTVTVTEDLPQLARALKATDRYVGLDSGALHLAVALGVPVLGLYGPGVVELFHPLGTRSAMISKQSVFECAPCLQRTCVHPDATCMDAIGVDEVVETFERGLLTDGADSVA